MIERKQLSLTKEEFDKAMIAIYDKFQQGNQEKDNTDPSFKPKIKPIEEPKDEIQQEEDQGMYDEDDMFATDMKSYLVEMESQVNQDNDDKRVANSQKSQD